jgi:dolichol-phosphate mannosyltransferase
VIYFLLPAYNEEKALPALLGTISGLKFPGEDFRVVVVDDGSSDGTPALLREWASRIPLTVLAHEANKGLGRAMRTGLTHLTGLVSDDDAVIALDSDNTHPVSIALRMREKQRAENLDVVIASRYASDTGGKGAEIGLAFHRKILSRGAGLLLRMAFPIRGAKDYTCGYRLYSGRILHSAGRIYGENLVEEPNFVCMVEILIKLARIGAKIGEVPLVLRYDLKTGASKMKIGRTVARYFGLIWRYRILGELRKFDKPGSS